MARKVRVRVDHHLCVGNAMCETFAPHVFRLNDDRQSEVVNPDGDTEEQILEAAENCPMSAILVEDAETGNSCFRSEKARVTTSAIRLTTDGGRRRLGHPPTRSVAPTRRRSTDCRSPAPLPLHFAHSR